MQKLAEIQAWAQNLGYESLTTMFVSYGEVRPMSKDSSLGTSGKRRNLATPA